MFYFIKEAKESVNFMSRSLFMNVGATDTIDVPDYIFDRVLKTM